MIASDKITYLDNNATTAIDPAVLEAMWPFLEKYFANPSSGYRFAAQVRDAIEQAREQVAALLGCEPGEIVFTSCGTESNNTAFHSALETRPECKHVVTTAVEHSAVRKPAQELERHGYEVTVIGVDKSGRLSLRAVADAIRPDTALVSVMWANNETGVIFPIEEIAEIARDKNVPLHTDAVQAAGKISINLREIQLQFLSISGHKLHAPKGVGALYVNRRSRFHPLLLGGSHENNRRAGTENAASIVALGKAAEVALLKLPEEQTRVRNLRDRFEKALIEKIPNARVNGAGAPRLVNTSSMTLLSELRYTDPDGVVWIAPEGSVVDGASIPRVLWSLMGGPFDGKYRNASVLHDVSYDQQMRPWKQCDRMFYDAMRCSGVGETEAKTMYYALYRHGRHWKRTHFLPGSATAEDEIVPRAIAVDEQEDVAATRDWIENARPSLAQIEARAAAAPSH